MRSRFVSAIICSALVVSNLVVSAQTAQAVWQCNTGISSPGAWAQCGQQPGEWYRVNMVCDNSFTQESRVGHGNWVQAGTNTPSTFQGCEWYEYAYGQPWAGDGY